jgi:hypothetical protein
MATTGQIDQLAAQVLARFDTVQTVDDMTADFAHLGIADAYRVQLALIDQRCARGRAPGLRYSATLPPRWHGWRTSLRILSSPCALVISCSVARSFACSRSKPASPSR